ncbi:hypothetical protein [Streptomyces sp. NPDC055109]
MRSRVRDGSPWLRCPAEPAFLVALADSLEEGTPLFSETPVVHGGTLGWD